MQSLAFFGNFKIGTEETKMKHLVLYVSILSVLVGCGSGSSDSTNSSNNSNTQTVLEGSWQSICFLGDTDYEIDTQTFSDNNIEATVNLYSDSACQTNTVTILMKGIFAVGNSKTLGTGETVNDLDVTFESATMTPKTSAMVDLYNTAPIFQCNGTKTYTLNQGTDISDCTFLTDEVNIGSPRYAIFFIDTDKLYSSVFVDSANLRPTAIDYSPNNVSTKL